MPDAKTALPARKSEAPGFGTLLMQRSAWGTCLGMFGYNYLSYFMLTWLPFYLMRERNFSMYSMAKIGGAAYIGGAILALLSGWLSDRWIRSGATATRVRKTFVCGGLAFAGIVLLLSAISAPAWSVALLILGIGFQHVSSSTYQGANADTSRGECSGDAGRHCRISAGIWREWWRRRLRDGCWIAPIILFMGSRLWRLSR